MRRLRWLALIAALLPVCATGCAPLSMGLFTPIPVPPWVTERMEEKYVHEKDFKTAILPPIDPAGPPPLCEDPPDESAILRAMPHIPRGMPYVYEQHRDDIQIVTERLVDKIDPARFFPLVGMAQLHHCHYKCTIYYTETVESGWPFPFRAVKPRVECVYIDKDHLHLAPNGSPDARRSVFRDTVGP